MKLSRKLRIVLAASVTGVGALVVVHHYSQRSERSGQAAQPPPPASLAKLNVLPMASELADYLRPEIREALGIDGSAAPAKRLDLLHGLDGELSADECQALLQAVLQPRPVHVPEGWQAEYVHELCLVLARQSPSRAEFARVLASIARDPARDEVVRDYALQHLRRLWENCDTQLQDSITATFREIVSSDPLLAPASLLSLHLLGSAQNAFPVPGGHPEQVSEDRFRFPDAELEPVVAATLKAQPQSANTAARMTAIRVVRERKLEALYPDMRRIVADTADEHAVVRMAAIATLATSGDPADRNFIATLDREDPRIDSAIRHALSSRP